ncbi:conserved hypothetical protein [Cupriavidus necator]|uniref:Uncharacterized protein n=1 Tax=Cupriavidus necator TaxID=106590 RepID=A0A1K0JHI3_CUPNE|nr:conserved hypothetical protein [Cupriavidus necator]
MVQLGHQYLLEALHGANRRLRASREISERQYLRTQEILRSVAHVKTPTPSKIEGVARAVATHYDDPPVPAEPIPTAEQAERALAHWLPAGLPTIAQDHERYIYLTDVPFELETAIRRWLRWQLDSGPETASTWLMHASDGLALSHGGWCAFMLWHHRCATAPTGPNGNWLVNSPPALASPWSYATLPPNQVFTL